MEKAREANERKLRESSSLPGEMERFSVGGTIAEAEVRICKRNVKVGEAGGFVRSVDKKEGEKR